MNESREKALKLICSISEAPSISIDNVETVNSVAPHEISREQQLYFKYVPVLLGSTILVYVLQFTFYIKANNSTHNFIIFDPIPTLQRTHD